MERWVNEDGVQVLFEIFGASQRLILNSLDYREARFTKYQLYLMLALASKEVLTMSQAASSLGCSKEQATRLVTALVDGGYVERLHCEENRKLVLIQLTEEGSRMVACEKEAARESLRAELEVLSEEERNVFFQSMKQFAGMLRRMEAYSEEREALRKR
ncbi:MAG: MarR family transcriptional regulator [Lachnospiraceae bacterium]|nr:MarR family transcriptional regulator [Lachnospiraceae bacterium]